MVIGTENERLSLSLKRLTPDPWEKKVQKYKMNDLVKGKITKITPFGAFVELDKEISGLVHISEVAERHISNLEKVLNIGDALEFKIISLDSKNRKIGLSLKKANKSQKDNKKDSSGKIKSQAKGAKKSKKKT